MRLEAGGLEHPVLLGRGQPRVQREHLQPAAARPSASAVSLISRSPLRKTRMSPAPRGQLVDRVDDRLALVSVLVDRPVADLDWVGPAGHLDDRRAAEGAANRSGSMVAEVMMTLRSGRRGSSCLR